MNEHLKLVRAFHAAYFISQAEFGETEELSDMEIISCQELLMAEGSELFKAFNKGDLVDILAALVNQAYAALTAVAMQGKDVDVTSVHWKHDGFVISIIRCLSEQIHCCTSGKSSDYSGLYCLCERLTRDFLNADFDKAFQRVHNCRMKEIKERKIQTSKHFATPDLSDCLFE